MLMRLYNWMLRLAEHPHAAYWLFLLAFTESALFPIPPDIMLLPLCLANRQKAFYFGFICLIGSVLGGIGGYAIGYWFFETIGRPILLSYGYENAIADVTAVYQEFGRWFVFISATTPIPYKVFTIASGALQLNLFDFIWVSLLGRGLRFMLVALLLFYFGAKLRNFIEKYLGWLTLAGTMGLIAGFFLIPYL